MAFTDLFKKAGGWIKANPGYAIGGAGGVGFIGYLLYKQRQGSTASGASGTQPSNSDLQATPSYDYLYGYYEGGQSGGSSGGSSGGDSGGTTGTPTTPDPNATPIYYTTQSGDTIDTIYAKAKTLDPGHQWGEQGIQSRNPALSGYKLTDKLPAGLKVQIGGPVPTGIGLGGIMSGWQGMMNHHYLWRTPANEFNGILN